MKTIGKTFGDEIQSAGLGGLPFSWGSDGGLQFSEAMTPQQVAAVQAVYEAHDPAAIPPWSPAPPLARLREAREMVLNRLAGIGLAALAASDTTTLNACLAARLSLLGMTTLPGVVAATDDASLGAALVAAYMAIVAAAPANLRSAFSQFNL